MDEIEQMASRADEIWTSGLLEFSICTVVTRREQYAEMLHSFRRKGFDGPDCEFMYVDKLARQHP